MRKRILASILTVIMLLSLLPTTVLASPEDSTSGKGTTWVISDDEAGNDIIAYLTSNEIPNETTISATYGQTIELPVPENTYTLYIKGTGSMKDYTATVSQGVFQGSTVPWSGYANQITKVVVESGIDKIGQYAFAGLPNLKEVTIADSVKEIGWRAFGWCASLDEFTIPEGATTLKNEFIRNTAITEITIPASVTNITYAALKYVDLNNIYVAAGNSTFISEDGVLYTDGGATLKCVPCGRNSFVIPETVNGKTVTKIGQWAFGACDKLTEINIPSHITEIGEAAFYECSGISTLTIPSTITSVAGSTFQYMTGLKDVYWNSTAGLKNANAWTDAGKNTEGGFTVYFGSELSRIPDYVVSKATYLTKVEIQNAAGVEIGLRSFWGCTGLTDGSIDFSKVNKVGTYAFAECTGLTKLDLPESVTEIGEGGFHSCKNISDVTLPSTMTKISQDAFKNCTSLTILNYNPINATCPGGRENYAFSQINSQELTVNIGKNVTNIPQRSFSGNTSLKTIVIPDNVTNIGAFAFNNCKNLETVIIGNGINGMGQDAFTDLPENNWICLTGDSNITSTIGILTRIKNPAYNTESGMILVMNGGKVVISESGEKSVTKENCSVKWYESADFEGNNVDLTRGNTYYAKWTEVAGTEDEVIDSLDAAENTEDSANLSEAPEETPTEVQKDVTSEPALDDAANEETANTETAAVPEQPAEEPENTIPEETPEVAVPEEENGTEEPVNSVEEVPVDDTVMTLQIALTFNDPAETTYYFYANGNELGHTTGTSLQYNTTEKGLVIGENVVQVYQGDKDNGGTSVGTIKVTLNQKSLTVSGLTAVDRTANGSTSVTLTGGSLVDVESGDTVGFTASGTMSDTAAGENKPVTVAVELTDTDAKWYTVTAPTDVTVNITSSSGSHSSGGSSSSTTYTVTVESAKNGAVKSDRASASKGTTVTLTVTPKDGYELDSLKVTDKDGKTIKTTEGKNGKYTFTMPASKVTVEASFAKIEEQSGVTFRDVPASAYYYDAVEWAVEKGVTSGTSATTFSPDAACTRAQAVTFLWRAAGSPAPKNSVNPFADVPASAYYYDAVLWAVEKGITSGTSATTFSPDATCTRGQIVTFLYRADGTAATGSNPFADVAASAYYADAVKWAVAEGVTSGTSATTFSPDASCTRAQIVTFLYRAEA